MNLSALFNTIGDLVAPAVTGGIVGGAVAWLVKTWATERIRASIRHEYAVLFEAQRARLSQDHALSLEQFKASLQVAAVEHQVRFSRLHDRVVDALASIYKTLSTLQDSARFAVAELTSAAPDPEQRQKEVAIAADRFRRAYRANRIYLPSGVDSQVDAIWVRIKELMFKHRTSELYLRSVQHFDKGDALRQEVDRLADREIPEMLNNLAAEFRRLLRADSGSAALGEPVG